MSYSQPLLSAGGGSAGGSASRLLVLLGGAPQGGPAFRLDLITDITLGADDY